MRKKKLTPKSKAESAALPGKPLSTEELLAIVQEAEKGPFFTIEESKKMFEAWRRKNYGS